MTGSGDRDEVSPATAHLLVGFMSSGIQTSCVLWIHLHKSGFGGASKKRVYQRVYPRFEKEQIIESPGSQGQALRLATSYGERPGERAQGRLEALRGDQEAQ